MPLWYYGKHIWQCSRSLVLCLGGLSERLYKIGLFYFSAKRTSLRSKRTGCLGILMMCLKWSDMSTRGLLPQKDRTMKILLGVLIEYIADVIIIKKVTHCRHCMAEHVQSVPITTNIARPNPVHGKVYSLQHYVIKFVSDLQQVGGFFWVLQFPPPIKLTAMI